MNVKRIAKPSSRRREPTRGRADLARLRHVADREIRETAPSELADLPGDFWNGATVVEPMAKQAISLRLDADVLGWFKAQGPRYQSRMNAVLRSFMAHRQVGVKRKAG